MNITLKQADIIIDAALADARNRNAQAMAIIVLDAGGHPVAFRREDNATLFRHDIAKAKATGALGMGIGTRTLSERAAKNTVFFNSVATVSGGNVAFSPGGVLIKNVAGTVIGAVGLSGDVGDVDEACAITGILAAELLYEV